VVAASVSGFAGVSAPLPACVRGVGSSTRLFAIRCEDKTYQLEEREDKDVWTTELFLNADRTVKFGQTDGAPFDKAMGTWEIYPGTNDFKMKIERRFNTGREKSDVGEFSFVVERTYIGEMTEVGESVGITGVIQAMEGLNNEIVKEVGYFNMIDGTDEKASYADKANRLSAK